MRHLKLFTCMASVALAFVMGGKALAQEVDFSINRAFLKPGETGRLTMSFTNTEKITALSGRISLPEGLTFVVDESKDKEFISAKAGRGTKCNDLVLTGSNTSAAFLVTSYSGLSAGSGELFTFDVAVGDNFASCDSIQLSELLGAIVVNGEEKAWFQDDFKTPVLNDNFKVVPTVADFSIAPGETKTISFELDDERSTILQCLEYRYKLPEGLSIVEDSYVMTDRTEGYSAIANDTPYGLYFALLPSLTAQPEDQLFKGKEGALFTFDVTADETLADESEIQFYNFMTNTAASDDLQMTFYYAPDWTVKVTKSSTSGINGVNGEDASADSRPDGIYSISGYKTDKLMKGLNIVIKNGKATKVVVK